MAIGASYWWPNALLASTSCRLGKNHWDISQRYLNFRLVQCFKHEMSCEINITFKHVLKQFEVVVVIVYSKTHQRHLSYLASRMNTLWVDTIQLRLKKADAIGCSR